MLFKLFNIKIKIMLFIKNLNINKFKKKNSNKYTKFFEIVKKIDKQTYRLKFVM